MRPNARRLIANPAFLFELDKIVAHDRLCVRGLCGVVRNYARLFLVSHFTHRNIAKELHCSAREPRRLSAQYHDYGADEQDS